MQYSELTICFAAVGIKRGWCANGWTGQIFSVFLVLYHFSAHFWPSTQLHVGPLHSTTAQNITALPSVVIYRQNSSHCKSCRRNIGHTKVSLKFKADVEALEVAHEWCVPRVGRDNYSFFIDIRGVWIEIRQVNWARKRCLRMLNCLVSSAPGVGIIGISCDTFLGLWWGHSAKRRVHCRSLFFFLASRPVC